MNTFRASLSIWICLIFASNALAGELSEESADDLSSMELVFEDELELSADALELEAIEISESPEQQVRNGTRPAFAQVITQPQLQSINDWLESANGVYGDASGKGTRSVIVRGFESRQLSFQFDGMPLDTGFDGMTVLDVLPMNWIGAGRIAHADASPTDAVGMGGKIDLYAFDPSLFDASLEVSLTGVTGSIAHGMKYGPWRWAASVGGMFSKGFYLSHSFEPVKDEDGGLRDSSEKKGGNFLLKAGRLLGDWGDIEITSGWAQAPRSVPTGVNTGNLRYWDYSSWRIGFISARFRWNADIFSGLIQVWANDQGNRLVAYDDALRETQLTADASTSTWQDDEYGGRLDLSSPIWALGKAGYIQALLRADLRYQRHESNEDTYVPLEHIQKISSRFYYDIRPAFDWQILPVLRVFASGYVTGTQALLQHSSSEKAQPGLEDIANGGFSIGLDYAIVEQLDLNFRAARRLRMPTLKEQFRNLPSAAKEIPLLTPETAWDFEMELHWKPVDWFALTIGGFDTEIRDLIEFRYHQNLKIAYNVAKSRIAGTDISAKIGAWYGVSLDLSYHYLYAYDLSQEHVLNDRPAHNLRFAVHYTPVDNLRLTLGGQYESQRRTEAWLTTKYAWLGDVFLLNAEIEYQLENVYLYLRGTNLTDYNYSRALGYPEPGFNVMLGAKLSM